jgi:endonuclease I
MKLVVFLILILSLGMFLNAEIPTGYYNSVNGLSGEELKTALHNIIDDHITFPYTATGTDVWDILKETDRDPDNSLNVILFYTGWSVNAAQEYNNQAGWNREHVWAKSHGDFGENPPAGTDVHHLRPCDITVNSARSNKDFDDGGTEYIDGDGATGCYRDSDSWEPRDSEKGDVARMIFYMAVRYEGDSGEPDLEMVDFIPSSPTGLPFHAKQETLLLWHVNDPVDTFEQNRNDIIYTDYQHNRNPFIDHPEYAAYIWEGGEPEPEYNIIITEIMQNPNSVFDEFGEWFEIYNAGTETVNINGWTIKDLDTDNHIIDNGGTLNIAAGDFLVLGNNSATATNGNYTCDYVFSNFQLSNGADEIIIMNEDAEIDRVVYSGTSPWPDPTGASMVFVGSSNADNNDAANWITAIQRQLSYIEETGDKGSPGSSGDDQALPVELVEFSVELDNQPTLLWTTESEEDNLGWNIFRSELEDGFENNDYFPINCILIPGMGNSTEPVEYSFIDEYPVLEGYPYWYWLQSISTSQELELFGPVYVEIPIQGEITPLPNLTDLFQNYPNPFNPETTIRFTIAEGEEGIISIYNLKGQIVFQNRFPAGEHELNWVANDFTSGLYFYKLNSPTLNLTRKMLLLK